MPKHDNAPPRAVQFFAHTGEESLYSRRGQAHEAPTPAIGSPRPLPPAHRPRLRQAAFTVAGRSCLFMESLDTTILNTAVPNQLRHLGIDWLTSARISVK